jgi:hypothetical protein
LGVSIMILIDMPIIATAMNRPIHFIEPIFYLLEPQGYAHG